MKKYLLIISLLIATDRLAGQVSMDSIKAIIQREVAQKRSKSIIVGIVDASGRKIIAEGILSYRDKRLP